MAWNKRKCIIPLALWWGLVAGGQATGAESAAVDALFADGGAIDEAQLDEQRGGADAVLNDIRSTGQVAGNLAYQVATGNNIITEGSFTGANGFSTVIQNSGNNVLIQSSTIINLQLSP